MLCRYLSAIAILTMPVQCCAGVVLNEQQVISQPGSKNITRYRSILIEGGREKSIIDNGKRIIITDLERGTKTVIDVSHKTYSEFPFPPKTSPRDAVELSTLGFKQTGAHDTIIGYSCDVYSGSRSLGDRTVTVRGCFSQTAPGASEYTDFQREITNKVRGTAASSEKQGPVGIPLVFSVTTVPNLPMGISGQRAAKLKEAVARHQLVTTTTISKITMTNLPAESFQVSPGYQKR